MGEHAAERPLVPAFVVVTGDPKNGIVDTFIYAYDRAERAQEDVDAHNAARLGFRCFVVRYASAHLVRRGRCARVLDGQRWMWSFTEDDPS